MIQNTEKTTDRDIHFTDKQGNEYFVMVREDKVEVWRNKEQIHEVRFYDEELTQPKTNVQEETNVSFYLATYEANELDEQPYKEVIAVFVDEIEAVVNGEKYFTSYAHLGQHSTCSQSFLAEKCRKATEEEYKDLKTELESIGYNINII